MKKCLISVTTMISIVILFVISLTSLEASFDLPKVIEYIDFIKQNYEIVQAAGELNQLLSGNETKDYYRLTYDKDGNKQEIYAQGLFLGTSPHGGFPLPIKMSAIFDEVVLFEKLLGSAEMDIYQDIVDSTLGCYQSDTLIRSVGHWKGKDVVNQKTATIEADINIYRNKLHDNTPFIAFENVLVNGIDYQAWQFWGALNDKAYLTVALGTDDFQEPTKLIFTEMPAYKLRGYHRFATAKFLSDEDLAKLNSGAFIIYIDYWQAAIPLISEDKSIALFSDEPLWFNTGVKPNITKMPVVSSTSDSSVTIDWQTDKMTDATVLFGLTSNYASSVTNSEMQISHEITLSNLDENTFYHYKIVSKDRSGNSISTEDKVFRIADLKDTIPPVITFGPSAVSITSTSAKIVWTTDEPSDSLIEYGLDLSYGSSKSDISCVFDHQSITLNGLSPLTQYHFRVLSKDRSINIVTSSDNVLTTLNNNTEPTILLQEHGIIKPAGDEDWYKFTISQPGTMVIPAPIDPGLTLQASIYASSSNTTAVSTTYLDSLNYSRWQQLTPLTFDTDELGTYYLKVWSMYNKFSDQPYSITANFTPRSTIYFQDEPNNSTGQATILQLNQEYQSYLYKPTNYGYGATFSGDEDWYKFTISQPGTMVIPAPIDPGLTLQASIYASSSNTTAVSTTYLDSLNYSRWQQLTPLTFDTDELGTYYLKVWSMYNKFSDQPYSITANFTPRSTIYFQDEPNNSTGQATILQLNQEYQSYLYKPTNYGYGATFSGDEDWYKFTISQPGTMVIPAPIDPGLTLQASIYASSSNTTAVSTTYLDSLNYSRWQQLTPLTFDTDELGTYYLKVWSMYNKFSDQPYSITANFIPRSTIYFQDEPNNSTGQATILQLNQEYQSYLYKPTNYGYGATFSGDEDWYKFTISQPGTMVIPAPIDPGLTLQASIYASSSNTTAVSTTYLDSLNYSRWQQLTPLTFDTDELGTYYLKVWSMYNKFSDQPYSITANFTPRSTIYFQDEPNNSTGQATILQLNQEYQSYLYKPTNYGYGATFSGDEDWYKFTISQPGTMVIPAPIDPGLTLQASIYASSSNTTAVSTTYLDSLNYSRWQQLTPLTFDTDELGTYYLKVWSMYNKFSDQPYTIVVNYTPFSLPATKLSFLTQPSGAKLKTVFNIQPVVAVQDDNGNTVTNSSASITLAITSETGTKGAILSEEVTVIAANGVAIFSGLSIDKAGTYSLTATSPKLTPATSISFNITDIQSMPVILSLTLQGNSRPDSGWNIPLTVKFFTSGNTTSLDLLNATPTFSFNINTVKEFNVATASLGEIAAGIYDITVVSPHTLLNVKRNVLISGNETSVNFGSLLDGNANDDYKINIQDFGVLAATYGKQKGQIGFDERADFDWNDKINIADFGLLAGNYGKYSPIEIP